jgi:PIN domain nuclease of toxin-antitoxin system
MNLLLDTHVLIWFINGDDQLPEKSINLIKNLENRCFVSVVSIWEIAIKLSLGKIDVRGGLDEISKIMRRYELELLPITFEHLQKLMTLDFHHRDPFDRIIISQGLVEKLEVVTKDENFPYYNIKIVWDK